MLLAETKSRIISQVRKGAKAYHIFFLAEKIIYLSCISTPSLEDVLIILLVTNCLPHMTLHNEASQLCSDVSHVVYKNDADRPRILHTTSLKPRLSRIGLRCVYFLARSLNRRLKPSLCTRAFQKSRDYV